MGQKTLDMFVAKRAKLSTTDSPSQRVVVATAAGAAHGEVSEPSQRDDPVREVVARGQAGELPADAIPAQAQPETVAAQQLQQFQRLRAHANRNQALAKQVVIGCERSGSLPGLASLLVEPSWAALLGEELGRPYFRDLERFVHAEWGGSKMVFPPKDAVFRAFNSCPVDQVKVVILGQDPYHDIGQAMGLSFSVPEGKAVPSSLRNIYKELREDCGAAVPRHGNLEKWAQQGVLLLNAVLTVRAHQAGSHAKKGWEKFTEAAISKLSQQRSGVVFLLWGRYAQDKARVICPSSHHVLTAAHPSGLSASRGFFGCRHFSKANELLQKEGRLPIDWQIE